MTIDEKRAFFKEVVGGKIAWSTWKRRGAGGYDYFIPKSHVGGPMIGTIFLCGKVESRTTTLSIVNGFKERNDGITGGRWIILDSPTQMIFKRSKK